MAGRKPKGEYSGKSLVFSTRISPELRGALEKAAKSSGRSLSQEVEHRLRGSFIEDDRIADTFGDRQTYRLMRMIADAIHTAEERAHMGRWLQSLTVFKIAMAAAIGVLDRVAPPDDSPLPPSLLNDDLVNRATKSVGEAVATSVWKRVQQADPALPVHRVSTANARASIAKHDLAELLERTQNAARDLGALQQITLVEGEIVDVKTSVMAELAKSKEKSK
jgi:hypothetical protein